jgi:hypothetical protein
MNTGLRNWQQEDSNRTEARLDHICESDARHRLRITDDAKLGRLFERMRQHLGREAVSRLVISVGKRIRPRWLLKGKISSSR